MKIAKFLLSTTMMLAALTLSAEDSIYRVEADRFISAMPAGLQHRQTTAIRKAIKGNSKELNKVRNSRNTPSELPEGVVAEYVTPKLRHYRPKELGDTLMPMLVYYHGGGWTIGSINSCARFCAAMVQKGVQVLAVDYALAPEEKALEGLFQCEEALEYAVAHAKEWGVDPEWVAVGGDSSGGNLAIATALLSRLVGNNTPVNSIVAFYPVVKAYNDSTESWTRYGKGYGLDAELMEAFNDAYTSRPHDYLVSVADAPELLLRKMPPLLIVAAERDILCDQGKEFVDKLASYRRQVERVELPGAVHLFITVPGQDAAFNRSVELASQFIYNNW
jgi:acetyl esterase